MRSSFRGVGLAVVVLLCGCEPEPAPAPTSSSAAAPASAASGAASAPAPSASAPRIVSEPARKNIQGFFDDVGDRAANAITEVKKGKPKSRLAYAEALALGTPAAFPAHRDLFDKRKIDMDDFLEVMGDPAFAEDAGMRVIKKSEAALADAGHKELPEVDEQDCIQTARRLVELASEGAPTGGVRAAMAPGFQKCGTLLPKHILECLPDPTKAIDVKTYDECVKKGEPKKGK